MDSFKVGDMVKIILTEEFREKLNNTGGLADLNRAIGSIVKVEDVDGIYWWRSSIPCINVRYVSGPCPWGSGKWTVPAAMMKKIRVSNPIKRVTNVRKI